MNTGNTAVQAVEDGMHTVTAHLVCAGAADAIAFHARAFGAVEVMRLPALGGGAGHHPPVAAGRRQRLRARRRGRRHRAQAERAMFRGDRYGVVEDPFGHRWSMAAHLRDASAGEVAAAMQQGSP